MTSGWEINQPSDTLHLDVPTDILCSYHYFKAIDMAAINNWGTRIIGDSGAFSAMTSGTPIDREEFHRWAAKWDDALLWVASLDVIGDPEATFQNYLASKRDGLELVPTIHYGDDPKEVDKFVEQGVTLMGLGGMVPYSSEKDRLMRWSLSVHRYARDNHPELRFHGWGISHPYLVDNLPWWSTDSSGFSSCFRFGTLRLWVPGRGRFVSVKLNGRDLAKYAKLLRDVYHTDWKLIAESSAQSRRPLGRVALRAVQLYSQWLQDRQKVSAPALLQRGLGPRNTAAMGKPDSQASQSLNGPLPKHLEVPVGPIAVAEDGPNVLIGPLNVAAMIPSAQGQSITPDGKSIGRQI